MFKLNTDFWIIDEDEARKIAIHILGCFRYEQNVSVEIKETETATELPRPFEEKFGVVSDN